MPRALVASAVLLTLAGCGFSTPNADMLHALPEASKRSAHLACHTEVLGTQIPQAIKVLNLGNGKTNVSTVNGPGITLAQARSINQCARRTLTAGGAVVEATPASGRDLAPKDYRAALIPESHPTAGCPGTADVMHGGTQYCLKR